jgi:hypothetical protein
MKYEIGQEVRVKGTDNVGIIKSYKIDGYVLYEKMHEVTKYGVQVGASYYNKWFFEYELESFPTYNFDAKFELELIDLLIDIYLLDKSNLNLIRQLHKEKSLYEVKE